MPNVPGLLVTTRRLCYQLTIAPPHRSGRFWPKPEIAILKRLRRFGEAGL